MTTEAVLRDWRFGSIQAERLCAGLLQISGFSDIDPQATLGGPDGKKDILARRAGKVHVAAVYFPARPPTFNEIRTKFFHDRGGVAASAAVGFVFFVNQYLTVGQRAELQSLGSTSDEIFHLERMRHLLDSPIGYGLRLEYLRRPMSPEEQAAFFSAQRQDITHQLLRNTNEADHLWDDGRSAVSQLNVPMLQIIHRAMTSSGPQHVVGGQLRAVQTVIMGAGGKAVVVTASPQEIPARLVELLTWWRATYVKATTADREVVINMLAQLHYGLVTIAPFLDGNGRLARLINDEAARELLGAGIAPDLIGDHAAYHAALSRADRGDIEGLIALMSAALERQA